MGEEITEVLEYQPGELYVKQYRRVKYALPDNGGILIGELPSRPLPKVIAGEGLLAQIIIDKYIDHLPLHRQMQRFERVGVKLPSTRWCSSTIRKAAAARVPWKYWRTLKAICRPMGMLRMKFLTSVLALR